MSSLVYSFSESMKRKYKLENNRRQTFALSFMSMPSLHRGHVANKYYESGGASPCVTKSRCYTFLQDKFVCITTDTRRDTSGPMSGSIVKASHKRISFGGHSAPHLT